MLRKIYLIRHGAPELQSGGKICLSRKDPGLSEAGRKQAVLLGKYFADKKLSAVYCSGLKRTMETAQDICECPLEETGFMELGVGMWDGLSFAEIRQRYPEIYVQRGLDPLGVIPPGGEYPLDCLKRGKRALYSVLEESEGDIAIVAHAGINRLLLSEIGGYEIKDFLSLPQPYGCINELILENEKLRIHKLAVCPE